MLPIFKSSDNSFMLMQTEWSSQLNVLLSNPICNGLLLKRISLIVGSNQVNHKLGRKLQGWFIVGINAVANIYDTQAVNSMPDKTLVLVSDADVEVNLYVF